MDCGICVHIVYGRLLEVTGCAKLYRGCAEIVQKPCDACAVAVQSPQIPKGFVQLWCRLRTEAVRSTYDHRTILLAQVTILN